MSDEMMTPTLDSSASATDFGGIADAIMDDVRTAAGYDTESITGVNDDAFTVQDDGQPSHIQGEPGPIPYDRFREVNERARQAQSQLDNWSEVIQGLQAQGYRSADDVRRALQEQQLQAQENEIRTRYQELENQNLVDSTTAGLQMQAELEAFRYKQAIAEARQYMMQNEKQKAFAQFPAAQQATQIVDSLIQQGIAPAAAIQLVASQVETLSKTLKSEVAKQVTTNRSLPTPASGGTTAPNVTAGTMTGGARSTLSQLLGINR
jgi:hypothetical protein